jgi:transcriptional regulator with XRE-family HTH domain
MGINRGPWAREIKRSRLRMGLTQQQLAELVGVAQPAVSEWERGAKEPSDAIKATLIGRLGIDPKDVVPEWLRGVVAEGHGQVPA